MIWLPQWYQRLIGGLGQKIRPSIKAGIETRAKIDWSEVEALLTFDPLLVKEEWIRMRGWYCGVE